MADERDRWSAFQLLQHPFISPSVVDGALNGRPEVAENNGSASSNGQPLLVDEPEPEEPLPSFSFFSGVPGKSRIKSEFEERQFLGKGGFGNVIKVGFVEMLSEGSNPSVG